MARPGIIKAGPKSVKDNMPDIKPKPVARTKPKPVPRRIRFADAAGLITLRLPQRARTQRLPINRFRALTYESYRARVLDLPGLLQEFLHRLCDEYLEGEGDGFSCEERVELVCLVLKQIEQH